MQNKKTVVAAVFTYHSRFFNNNDELKHTLYNIYIYVLYIITTPFLKHSFKDYLQSILISTTGKL